MGLQDKFLEAPFASVYADTVRAKFNGFDCTYDIERVYEPEEAIRADRSVCVHRSGLPVFMDDAEGRRIFEVTKLVLRRPGHISPARFAAPRDYRVSDKKPEYLTSFTC